MFKVLLIQAYFASVFFILFVCILFLVFIGVQSFHHQVEVDFVPVEFRSVNANEFWLTIKFDSAAAAHTGAVNHNGVERYLCRYIKLFCYLAAELHHYSRANYEDLVRLWISLTAFFQWFGYQCFSSV